MARGRNDDDDDDDDDDEGDDYYVDYCCKFEATGNKLFKPHMQSMEYIY